MKTLFLICVALSVQAPGFLWASTPAEKKAELNGSSWDIVLMAAGGTQGTVRDDIYTFKDGQFRSKRLLDRGFEGTNYSISLPDDASDLAVWETMQTTQEGVVFLHGEWAKDKMWGTVTEQLDHGRKIADYTFVTRKHWKPKAPEAKKGSELKKVKIVPSKVDPKPIKMVSIKPETPAKMLMPVFKPRQEKLKTVLSERNAGELSSADSGAEDKFSQEIEKFEKAQALKISQ